MFAICVKKLFKKLQFIKALSFHACTNFETFKRLKVSKFVQKNNGVIPPSFKNNFKKTLKNDNTALWAKIAV